MTLVTRDDATGALWTGLHRPSPAVRGRLVALAGRALTALQARH